MRLLTTLLVIFLATAQLMADPSVESCAADTSTNGQQNTSTLYHQPTSSTPLNVFLTNNEIHVNEVADGSILYIYSITGARVGQFTVRDNKVILDNSLAKGIYIIRVNNRAAKITVR